VPLIMRPRHLLVAVRNAGLTLVELLVALSIGLFLTLGLFLMMSDSSRTFKIQDDFARMQDNAVTALRYVNESARHAGFYGIAAETLTLNLYGTLGAVNITAAGGLNCGAVLQSAVPVFGYHGQTAAGINGILPCIRTANFRDPSSVLITRMGSGFPVPDPPIPPATTGDGNLTDGIVTIADFATTVFVQTDANAGWVFLGNEYAAMRAASQHRTLHNGADAPIFPFQMHVYYVRPCSRPTGGGGTTCAATDDNGNPVPTLVRQELLGTTMVERPLAEGIERFVVTYGVDVNPAPAGDGIADRYVTDPTTVAADGWARVVTIRVALLVRSPTPVTGYDDQSKSYDLNGDGVADFRCTDAGAGARACEYKRALFSQVIQLRNLAYRRGA